MPQAQEVELERLVVRLLGDSANYEKMLKDAEQRTRMTADRVSKDLSGAEQGVSSQLGQATQSMANRVQGAAGLVGRTTNLMRASFSSTSDALRSVGDVTGLLPGPFGMVASAGVGAFTSIISVIEGPLRRAQERARDGFMAVTEGMRSIEQSKEDVKIKELREGMERLVNIANRTPLDQLIRMQPDNVAAFESEMNRIDARIRRTLAFQRQLFENPTLRQHAGRMAVEEIGSGMMERLQEMQHMVASRELFRTLRGGSQHEEGVAIRMGQAAVRRLEIEQLRRRVGAQNLSDAQAEAMLHEKIAAAQQRAADIIRMHRREQLRLELEDRVEQHRKQVAGLTDDYIKLAAAQRGVSDIELKRLEMELTDARELEDLRRRGATPGQLFVVAGQQEEIRTLKMRAELLTQANQVMVQSRNPTEVYNREIERLAVLVRDAGLAHDDFNRAARRAFETMIQATPPFQRYEEEAKKGLAIWEQTRTPVERLTDRLSELDAAYHHGFINEEQYARAQRRITDEAYRMNEALQPVQGSLRGSADAVAKYLAYASTLRRPLGMTATNRPFGPDLRPPELGPQNPYSPIPPGQEGGGGAGGVATLEQLQAGGNAYLSEIRDVLRQIQAGGGGVGGVAVNPADFGEEGD